MQAQDQIQQSIVQALTSAIESGKLALETLPEVTLERPRDEGHGDWACTIALRLVKQAHAAPRDIAQIILDNMASLSIIEKTEIAGPGFINFYLNDNAAQSVVETIRTQQDAYGKVQIQEDAKPALIEYISANPTGPMHVGHGRWAALGSALANIMRHTGTPVDEEFYINDHGVQMKKFGLSIQARYEELFGNDASVPEGGYNGSYVKDIAQALIDEDGDMWLGKSDDQALERFTEFGYAYILNKVQTICDRFDTHFDYWQSERQLYEPQQDFENHVPLDFCLERLAQQGDTYEKEGALWFASSKYGDEKDRVLKKADGEYTYLASDVAYHYWKAQRGYNPIIDIWGADHHGYIARITASLEAQGYPDVFEVVLGQLVNLFRDGKPVRMSKRTGEMITFEELIDEVGVDATRYLMLSKSSDQPIDFDIEVAKKQDASNPVYYVQYAHARICSLLRNAAGKDADDTSDVAELVGLAIPEGVDLSPLIQEQERSLMRKLDEFPVFVANAARDRAPFRLTHYAQDLAAQFHHFYTVCPVMKADSNELRLARLALADATRIVLALTLNLLGISAPQRM